MTRPPASDPVIASDRRTFTMKACLGRGGFGEVYRATMASPGGVRMDVAVKVLHAEVDPLSQAVQRLRDEARLLGAIRHPCVLGVHGLVMLDGRVAMVAEYVEGADLDKCVRGDDPIPRRGLVEMTGRVAEALDAAWRAPSPDGSGPLRLVHRDIKPANIRLGKHGEVKLLDFGIARAGNLEREARTETNAMLGSYLYMAPERFLDGNDHGPAIDVFALGCTLYECLAGQRLFAELTLKDMYLLILDAQKYERFVQERLERLPRDLEPELVALVYRLVALAPRERPSHTELARTCADLTDRMPGRTLDRWARGRVWPAPKLVRGVLDGAVLTESQLSVDGGISGQQRSPASLAPSPAPLDSGSVSRRRMRTSENPSDTFEGVIGRTVSATFERPSVVVGMGMGVVGLGALAGVAVLVVLALAGVGYLAWRSSQAEDDGLEVVVTPPPAELVVEPAPPVAPDPKPPRVQPTEPVPPKVVVAEPPPEPITVVVKPAEAPRPEPPRPEPPKPVVVAPAPQQGGNATVLVEGVKVLVEFRGVGGTTRSRTLAPGQYDVVAWFNDRPKVIEGSTNYLAAGTTYTLKCSATMETCTWK